MKTFSRFTLLFLWLFAIGAPSVLTLINNESPVVITNLNEEEHQETGKKTPVEEKFVHNYGLDFSLIAQSKKSTIGDFPILSHIDYTLEILLPPPEHIG